MHRFIVPPDNIIGDEAIFPAEEVRHALRVLRLKPGDDIVISDGQTSFAARLTIVSMGEARARLISPLKNAECETRVTLYQGLTKSDKLEWIVQKATELGVFKIAPVVFSRSVAKAEPGDIKKLERLNRIAQEAVKQCGRVRAPQIDPPTPLETAISDMASRKLLLLPWEEAQNGRIRDAYEKHPEARDIGVVIGPEGGITEAEVQKMRSIGALTLSLGPRILRAETAAVASAAMILQLWGDL